jgi:hypothetical protein
MARRIAASLVIALISTLSQGEEASPSDGGIPELVVSILPSVGVVPLDAEDRFAPYTFSVHSFDRESKRWYAGVQLFVRPGQNRLINSGNEKTRLRGYIELGEDGLAKYRLELTADGKTLARTSATIKVVPTK